MARKNVRIVMCQKDNKIIRTVFNELAEKHFNNLHYTTAEPANYVENPFKLNTTYLPDNIYKYKTKA